MFKKMILSVVLLSVVALAGCNTTRGAGQDIENTGRNLKQTVDHNS